MNAHAPTAIRNAMTVDVEDYFQVQAFAGSIPRAEWEHIPRRVEANTDRILAQFERAGVTATFFTLGWIAERHPGLIRRIVAAGHELASHGYDHTRADAQREADFRADVRRAKGILEDTAGCEVIGYRAATFSIGRRNPWAFAVLASEGYRYSSSIYPVKHDLYGMPDAPRFPFQPEAGSLWEFPMTTARLLDRNLPCSGGGYFRLLPYRLFRLGLAPDEPPRAPARHLLYPPVGDRPGPATGGRMRTHVPLPALRELVADRPPARAAATRLRLGPDGPGLRRDAGEHAPSWSDANASCPSVG